MKRLLAPLLVCCVAFAASTTASGLADARHPQAGQTPTDPIQLGRIKLAREKLATALWNANADAISAAETDLRKVLGPFAGVPETAESLNKKGKKASRPSVTDYRKLSERMFKLGSGSEKAKNNQMELRDAAYLAIGLLAMAEARLPDAAAYRTQAAVELDYLISKQAAEGYFPYPASPAAPEHLQRRAAKVAKDHPDKVKDGFLYVQADGTQFDTGCAAYALAYGYQVLKDERFLNSARKAGDWALTFSLSPNWNYNSFSVWQLAKIGGVTGERRYVDGAIRIAKLGILPGQMESGRWSDQHNAKSVYHWIMVRGLVELVRVLPADHPDRNMIRDKTKLAVQSRVDDILRHGGVNQVSALVALTESLDVFGANSGWEAALAEVGGISPYSAGVYARRRAAVTK
ncbi:MAG: hypothetical protein JNM76_06960 [Betaproteobacteria bacterium]|nr:hypothetical protein [Betaproteobacteria bacterium]